MSALSTLLFLLPHLQEVVEGIVERFVGPIDDGSPVRNDGQPEREVTLNEDRITVGI